MKEPFCQAFHVFSRYIFLLIPFIIIPMNDRKIDYKPLNGLRGLALLLVIFSHASNQDLTFIENISIAGNGSGKMGVYLFFVLSAFLLTDQILKRHDTKSIFSKDHLSYYAKRRFLRIYPLYTLFILVLMLAYYLFTPSPFDYFESFDFYSFLSHLALLDGQAHLWTIATEFKFYFLLPLICYAMLLCRDSLFKTTALIAGLSCIALLSKIMIDIQLGLYIPIFLCGCFAAFLFNRYPDGFIPLGTKSIALLSLLFCLMLICIMPHPFYALTGIYLDMLFPPVSALTGALWGGFLLFILWYDGLLTRIMKAKWLCYIGMISYSAYLWHALTLDFARDLPISNAPVQTLLFYSTTLALAHISYKLVEEPFLRKKAEK